MLADAHADLVLKLTDNQPELFEFDLERGEGESTTIRACDGIDWEHQVSRNRGYSPCQWNVYILVHIYLGMDFDELRRRHEHLETATDAAYMLRELEWKNSGLSDEELAPEYNDMFRRLEALSKRSLRESLEHTDPRALFDMVCYAKHFGMWKGYEENQRRLRFLEGA